jgi:magnesium chelatase subunit I
MTHYPKTIAIGKQITEQEAHIKPTQREKVGLNELVKDLIEQVAFEARESEYVDEKSGVSARLTISAYENLMSAAERRTLLNGEQNTFVRVSDFVGVIPAITGKIELVYEGEQEGPGIVANTLVGKAIRTLFTQYFPNPESKRKDKEKNPYKKIIDWFGEGNQVDILNDLDNKTYQKALQAVPGLAELVNTHHAGMDENTRYFMMEFALHGLAEFSQLSKNRLEAGLQFKDLLSSMFSMPNLDEEDEDDFEDRF